jgi:2-polyprenyl-6-methoxyphenol hydroxylase-like FAD-dependent oxidoreductase
MKVSIVGGSLGGLTAACLLRDLGYDVSVYERSAVRLEQRGAGIGFLPATYRYLQSRAGVDLTKISVATSKIVYLDADSNVTYEAAHNYLFSSWNTVYASTLDHFGMQEEANSVRTAVDWCLNNGFVTKDIDTNNSYTTTAIGDMVAEFIERHAKGEKHPIHERLHKSTII